MSTKSEYTEAHLAFAQGELHEDILRAIILLKGSLLRIHGDGGSGGLARQQLGALGILSSSSGRSLSELAELLRISRPQATRLAQRLEKMGLVESRADGVDGRARKLELSEAGRQALAENVAQIKASLGARLSALSPDELTEFKASLDSLVRILEKLGS